jgi:hypothetical protein
MFRRVEAKYIPGDHWVMCELCGMKYRRSECRKNWKGQIVCMDTCYEPRHPQDTVKVRPDTARPSDPRPDSNHTLSITNASTTTASDLEASYDDSDVDFITGYR